MNDHRATGSSWGRAVQSRIYREGLFGRTPRVPVSPAALENAARRRSSRTAWAYVAGSAGTERTTTANRDAFADYQLMPRVLRDVAARDTGVSLFGDRLPGPLLFAPVGALEIVHRHADLAVAAAARELGLPMVLSNQASVPMETTAAALGDTPHWFQFYWPQDDELAASLISRAEASGASAIVVTVDTAVLGWRPRDLDRGWLPFARGMGIAQYLSDPVFIELAGRRVGTSPTNARLTMTALRNRVGIARRHPGRLLTNLRSPLPRAAVQTFLEVFSRASLTWNELAWLRERTKLPIILKGLQHPDDAGLALDHGVDGIIVSNHGGRLVDSAIPSLRVLPTVVDRVAERVPVLFDSGIRSGADMAIALALGARAVLVGRPYVHGLAVAGQTGVTEVMANLLAEFDLTLALCGLTSPAELDRSVLAPS